MDDGRPLYLIRHGQTVWNREGRLQGGKDSPLTAKGTRQAEMAGALLHDASLGSILTSPLGRARRTAEIIGAALNVAVQEDARLSELRFGEAEGLTLDDIDRRWPDFRERREQDKWHVRWPGGEGYRDADRRVSSLVTERLKGACPEVRGEPLAIVGHETMNMILMGRLLDLDPSMVMRIGQPNGVVYRLVDRMVDHAHVGDDDPEWIPGMCQKRSDEIIHVTS